VRRAALEAKDRAELQLSAQRSERDALRGRLGRAELIAPTDGRIVFIKPLSPGDEVKAYETLLCVSDDAHKKISCAYISALSIEGAYRSYALVGGREYPLTPIPADVRENLAITLNGGELRSEFEFSEPDDAPEIGQYALVCVELMHIEDALIVPRDALNLDAAGRFVYKFIDGARVRCPVKTGRMTQASVQILEGLAEGDEVYVKG
jgi:multidrug efflux pump subunit AcrA (membrane-fusion protein)